MEIHLQESVDWCKLTNEIPNIKGTSYFVKNISFVFVPTLYASWQSRSQGISPLWYQTRYKQHTFSTIQYQKRKMPGIQDWFHHKILAELLKNFNHKKSHINLETNIMSKERNFWKCWILAPKINMVKHL